MNRAAQHAFMVSAAHKSSGKTTVSIGLAAALSAAGHRVQSFKKGPDYIDPMWLTVASGRPCRNLDPYLSDADQVRHSWLAAGRDASVRLLEGNKGLYDGLALDGSNSNAALAKQLGVPVILVLDCRGTIRGVAPLVLGYQAFDPAVRIAGIILNRVAGERHERKLREVLALYTQVPVFGAIPETPELAIVERHLGLMPSNEADSAADHVALLGRVIARHVDLERLIDHTRHTDLPPAEKPAVKTVRHASTSKLRLGIARDRAFGFYYADDLEALAEAGAELISIDTVRDTQLPALDALFIGGGFPETAAASLEANQTLRRQIKVAIESGLPTYAECGGLMYLSQAIHWQGRRHEMVGVIPADTVMHAKPVGRGYVTLEATEQHPWWPAGTQVKAHEFHYSALLDLPAGLEFGWAVRRGTGIGQGQDGLRLHNLLASYAHLRSGASGARGEGDHWARAFLDFARRQRAPNFAKPDDPHPDIRSAS